MKTLPLLLAAPFMAAAACAQVQPAATDMTLLSVSATGESKAAPDIAAISAGVVTNAPTAGEAMQQNAARMERVIAALRAAGVERKDIQTSSLNLNPQYNYRENQPPRITGYEARNTVSVKMRDLTESGKALDALVAEGANQINGPSFEIEDQESATNAARRDAMQKARARADIYASAAGMDIARIVSISEGGGQPQYPGPRPVMRASMDIAEEASTPIEPGQLGLNAQVTVVYELK
ncbi:MAG: SIMPL domain-containing protein [Pacificimonas sp.]